MANYVLPSVVEKRVRFFDGQFLQDQDFIDEQKYHLDRERRHLRLLHVGGIADGLAVAASASQPNQVTVAPGTAIDSDGRQLALAQTATVDLPAEKFNDKQGVELYMSYRESAEDEQTEAGSRDFTRWLERPQLTAIAPGEAYAGATPPVLLARVTLDSAGRVTVDDTVRSYSGLRLPGPAADAPTLRSTAGGQVGLTGSLTVDGNVGIGTTTPEQRLTVNGELRFTTATTISSAGRLHISGDEILYLLNKSGVIVGKEWGGSGDLYVEGKFSQASDARLKKRIQRLESTLDRLTEIRGVSYLPRRVGGLTGQAEERPAIGVIAQEVEAVFPELVSTTKGQGYKGVDYGGLTAVLLEAVKELKTALDPLQARVAALEARA